MVSFAGPYGLFWVERPACPDYRTDLIGRALDGGDNPYTQAGAPTSAMTDARNMGENVLPVKP